MLGRIFGKKKGASLGAPPPLSSSVRSAISQVAGARGIPVMPFSAQKAFQLSTSPKADARDFIQLLESDEGLSARILKIANSVYFDRGKKSETLEQAVTVVGINELKSILNANSLADLFPSSHPLRSFFWKHNISVAIAAKVLASKLAPGLSDSAFMAGLMHDIGKLFLVQRAPEEYSRILASVESRGLSFRTAEAEVFPFDHSEVGQLIAEKWNFPDQLISAIRNHHAPVGDYASSAELSFIICAADTVVHALGLGHTKGLTTIRREAEERLTSIWEKAGTGGKELLNEIKRTVETEEDLYSGRRDS